MSDPRFLQDGFEKRLSHAVEEAAEFIEAAMKLQRWGPFSVNPLLPAVEQETNLAWLVREMADVKETQARLREAINQEFNPDE